ncbi:MFS transporter [Nocardia sp. NPDC060256]|uniref:MFS transporter n=1 Tax=unclassified Nocardia TaxID=2637762 RepID=UPI003658D6B7
MTLSDRFRLCSPIEHAKRHTKQRLAQRHSLVSPGDKENSLWHIRDMHRTEPQPAETHASTRSLVAISAGTMLENYDWVLYGLLINQFAPAYFGSSNPLLGGWGVFALGFLARPLGGIIFGWLADARGRRSSMLWAVTAAAVSSLGIALTPTADAIGFLAPVALVCWRLLAGFAAGGELPVAQTYLAELAPRRRRNLWSSTLYLSGSIGSLGAIGLAMVSLQLSSLHDVSELSWRIPFFIGGISGLAVLLLRTQLHESVLFTATDIDSKQQRAFSSTTIIRPMLAVAGLTAGVTSSLYVWSAATTSYATATLGLSKMMALSANGVATILFATTLPLFGLLADRIGARAVMATSAGIFAIAGFPLAVLLTNATASRFLVSLLIATLCLSAMCAVLPAMLSGLFPTRIRATGQAIPYSITVSIFGGTAPWLHHLTVHYSVLFAAYLALLLAITAFTARKVDRLVPAEDGSPRRGSPVPYRPS